MRRILIATAAVLLAASPLAACKKAGGADTGPAALAKAETSAKAWMANNAKQPGVVSLPSGLQYKVLASGPATGAHPRPQDQIKIQYEGKLTTGLVFDSSMEEGVPRVFRLGDLIPGWIAGIQLMRPGDDWILYLPPELGYGPDPSSHGGDQIPPNAVLIFRIQLLDSLPGIEASPAPSPASAPIAAPK